MKNSITVCKWWWGWAPDKIEDWLEDMEKEGWNLEKVSLFGIKFTFAKGAKRKIRYCADYEDKPGSQYFQIFADDGWTLVWSGAIYWYMWRKVYTDQRPEPYSDQRTLIAKNAKSIKMFLALAFIYIIIMLIQLPLVRVDASIISLLVILGVGVLFFISISLTILKHNRRLIRERIRE